MGRVRQAMILVWANIRRDQPVVQPATISTSQDVRLMVGHWARLLYEAK